MHQTASGKATLAHLPKQRVKGIINQHGLSAAADSIITTESELFEELEMIRDQGYAFNKTKSTDGLHAVSVPLMGPERNILGAFAVSDQAIGCTASNSKTRFQKLYKVPSTKSS